MHKSFLKAGFLSLTALAILPAFAATPMDLSQVSADALSVFVTKASPLQIKAFSQSVDFKQTAHVRVQQTYLGYPVWGADVVLHVPNAHLANLAMDNVLANLKANHGFMNGTLYQNVAQDLINTPPMVFSQAQADLAIQRAQAEYQHATGAAVSLQQPSSQLIVYIDDNHQAHWAYKVSFLVKATRAGDLPAKPVYLLDALSFQVYSHWNDIKTEDGGGFGGNKKMGKLVYDGMDQHLATLDVTRKAELCYLQNTDVKVESENDDQVISFKCKKTAPQHNKVYWDGALGAVNGGFSPGNDALFGGGVIKHMYQDWYNVPVLTNSDGTPMQLEMVVNANMDNAYWDGRKMVFGDGIDMFYPLTSLGVAAHEISHGFTEQHSDLAYTGQSGGMNEAYSDMAAQAAEFYAYGKNSWQIGPEIFKAENEALRYMDQPSKDCKGQKPGSWCSIDNADQYYSGLDVHFSSGVYNRFFYLLGTSEGWDTKKAFDVMVHANTNYWTSTATFKTGACGVVHAAKDLNFDIKAVKAAFAKVKVNTKGC